MFPPYSPAPTLSPTIMLPRTEIINPPTNAAKIFPNISSPQDF